PIPPNKHAPPEIRTGRLGAAEWTLVGVFPRVVIDKGNLIDQLAPEILHRIETLILAITNTRNPGNRSAAGILGCADFLEPLDICYYAIEIAVHSKLAVERLGSCICRKNDGIHACAQNGVRFP